MTPHIYPTDPGPQSCERCQQPLVVEREYVPNFGGRGRLKEPGWEVLPCEACAKADQDAADEREKQQGTTYNRDLWRVRCGIPKDAWALTLEANAWGKAGLREDTGNGEALDALRGWVQRPNAGLLVHGQHGTGKSVAAAAAVLDCIRTTMPQEALLLAERDLPSSWKREVRHGEETCTLFERAQKVEVLALDDMGRRPLERGTGHMIELLYDLLDARLRIPPFAPQLKTLFVSQLDFPALMNWCKDHGALQSRLGAMISAAVELRGADIRRNVLWLSDRRKGK